MPEDSTSANILKFQNVFYIWAQTFTYWNTYYIIIIYFVIFILQLSHALFINTMRVSGLNYLWVLFLECGLVFNPVLMWSRPLGLAQVPAERSSARQGSLWRPEAAPGRSRVAAPPRAPGPSGRARLRPGREAPFDQQRPGRAGINGAVAPPAASLRPGSPQLLLLSGSVA